MLLLETDKASWNIWPNHYLVGGWTNPFEKYYIVKLDHFPRDRGENKKYLKPPPSYNSDTWIKGNFFSGILVDSLWWLKQWPNRWFWTKKSCSPLDISQRFWLTGGHVFDVYTHRIHVWYIYLHLPYKATKCREIMGNISYMDCLGYRSIFMTKKEWCSTLGRKQQFCITNLLKLRGKQAADCCLRSVPNKSDTFATKIGTLSLTSFDFKHLTFIPVPFGHKVSCAHFFFFLRCLECTGSLF